MLRLPKLSRPKLRASNRRQRLLSSFTLALLAVAAVQEPAAANQRDRTKNLKSIGEWRVIQHKDPFADPQVFCSIRSTGFDAASARRERPRLRISLNRRSFVIDPSFKLTSTVRVLRDILQGTRRGGTGNQMKQFKPSNQLVYKLRVDDGTVITNQDQTPRFEPWNLKLKASEFDQLIEAMKTGKVLYIGWKIDRASEDYSYKLEGFADVTAIAEQHCPGSGATAKTPAAADDKAPPKSEPAT